MVPPNATVRPLTVLVITRWPPRSRRGGGGHYPGETGTLANNPNVALLNNQRGYQLFTVTPDAWRAEVKVMDQVDRPGGQISTIARFVVDPNQPGPQSG